MKKFLYILIFAVLFSLSIVSGATVDSLYDDFEDDSLDTDLFNFTRPTSCDGGSAWAESGGSASATCTCTAGNWQTGIQLTSSVNWSKTNFTAEISFDVSLGANRELRIGWANGTTDGTFDWREFKMISDGAEDRRNISWITNDTGIRIEVNGDYNTSLNLSTKSDAYPTIAVLSGGGYTASIDVWQINSSFIQEVIITLISPINGTATFDTGINFTANHTLITSRFNLTNTTYYVWNSSADIFNTTTVDLNGTSNSTTLFINGFDFETYEWNVYTCWINSTYANCTFDDSNFTFDRNRLAFGNSSFSNETVEGTLETFVMNVSIITDDQISVADLIYNSTRYSGTITDLGSGNYTLTRILRVPDVSSHTNFSFYWSVVLDEGSGLNSSASNQSVIPLNIDDCSAYTFLILNYTLRDEVNQSILPGGMFNTSMEIDLKIFPIGLSIPIINLSQTYSYVNPAQVCLEDSLLNGTEYRMDVQMKYEALDREVEYHNIQNFSLTNTSVPQNINLYDLNISRAQQFLITFKDANFLPVEDALIDIQRKYVADGLFRSVEIPITDEFGQTVGQFDLDGTIYTIVVSKNGEILATFDNIAVVCQDIIIEDCRLNLNIASEGTAFPEWQKLGGIEYTMTFNNNTKTITVVFSTTDGSSKTILLNTTKYDRFGNQTVCSDTLTSSSGTLTCVVPDSFGNVTVISRLYSDGQLITTRIYTLLPDARDFFGDDALVMVLILLLTIPLMLAGSPAALIIGIILGLIMAMGLMLLQTNSLVGGGAVLLWVIVAGGILIWKINQKKS